MVWSRRPSVAVSSTAGGGCVGLRSSSTNPTQGEPVALEPRPMGAGALISILQARLTRGHAREKVAGKRQSARDDVLIAWEPSREVKGLQGAIVMDVPVHRVVTKGTVQEGLFRGRRRRTHAETPHRHVHARRR